MVFVPPSRFYEDVNERKKRILLQSQGVDIVFLNVKGSDIGVISKVVSEFELDDYNLKRIIPQDKEILSMQVIPYKVIYQTVDEWMLIITYRK
jgi:hypothetical protein